MKTKSILTVALGLLVSLAVSGQGQGMGKEQCDGNGPGKGKGMHKEHKMKTPEERASKQTARMTTDLGLDEKQVKEVEAINLEFAKKAKVNRDAARAEREKFRAEKKAQRDAMRAEKGEAMKKVLTPEQYEKFEAKRAEKQANKDAKREKGKHHKKGNCGRNFDTED